MPAGGRRGLLTFCDFLQNRNKRNELIGLMRSAAGVL
jgi:hypothetical protein